MRLCVFCAFSSVGEPYESEVRALGERLGNAGCELVFGGFDSGLMGAIADGFAKAGAEITGVVPRTLMEGRTVHAGCTQVIETATLTERKSVMVENSDAFVVAPGGIGTLDELFVVLDMSMTGERVRPIVLFDCADFFDGLYDYLCELYEAGFVRKPVEGMLDIASDPESVMAALGIEAANALDGASTSEHACLDEASHGQEA